MAHKAWRVLLNVLGGDFTQYNRENRIEALDAVRGISIIYVVLYHFLYDLAEYGFMGWWLMENSIFQTVHIFFLYVLIGLSGICTAFSRNIFRRGAILLLIGGIITIVTDIVIPDSVIVFGILSFLGTIMLIYGIIKPALDKLNPMVLLAICVILVIIFRDFETKQGVLHLLVTTVKLPLPTDRTELYPLGILSTGFHSDDFFPLIPYGFVFLAGTALSGYISGGKLPKRFYEAKVPFLAAVGKFSLIIYIVHQPVFVAAMLLINTNLR